MIDLFLGAAGLIDHGKPELAPARVDAAADRLPDEKRRCVAIDVRSAERALNDFRPRTFKALGRKHLICNILGSAAGPFVVLMACAAILVNPSASECFGALRLFHWEYSGIALTQEFVRKDFQELRLQEPHYARHIVRQFSNWRAITFFDTALMCTGQGRLSGDRVGLTERGLTRSKELPTPLEGRLAYFGRTGVLSSSIQNWWPAAVKRRETVPHSHALVASDGTRTKVGHRISFQITTLRVLKENRLLAFATTAGLTSVGACDILGGARRCLISSCEYLDQIGFTRRESDLRYPTFTASPAV